MRVKLIKESSGFGYTGKITDWIIASDENMGKLDKLKQGKTVEIPQKIAISIYNLVDVETGKIISKRHWIQVSLLEIERLYKDNSLVDEAETRKNIKDTLKVNLSSKVKAETTFTKISTKSKNKEIK